ncbi:DNA repair protein RadA, partial [bacterium]|nr:DNA repair protein RadA [bacterium]
VGEIGLTGEVRTVSFIEKRIEEVRKLGFKRCIIPENNLLNLKKKEIGIELTGVKTVKEALEKGYL